MPKPVPSRLRYKSFIQHKLDRFSKTGRFPGPVVFARGGGSQPVILVHEASGGWRRGIAPFWCIGGEKRKRRKVCREILAVLLMGMDLRRFFLGMRAEKSRPMQALNWRGRRVSFMFSRRDLAGLTMLAVSCVTRITFAIGATPSERESEPQQGRRFLRSPG